jgi:hypothetical protein
MLEAPEISLIVCVYNQRDYLEMILSALRAQDWGRPIEVLICDDGSSDNTLETVRHNASSWPFDVRYIWQPDRGFRVARSRNNAIRCAQGAILVFVDGDTWLAPSFLRDHWSAHQQGAVIACGLRRTIARSDLDGLTGLDAILDGELRKPTQRENMLQRVWCESARPWLACLSGNFSIPAGTGIFFDERFEGWGSEDRDFAYRLFQNGYKPVCLPLPNALHIRPVSDQRRQMSHDEVVAFLRNKLLLREKYPNGEMGPSFKMVARCAYEPVTGHWFVRPENAGTSVETVLSQFESWSEDESRRRAAPAPSGLLPGSLHHTDARQMEGQAAR